MTVNTLIEDALLRDALLILILGLVAPSGYL